MPGPHPLSGSGLTGDLLAGDRGPVLSCHASIYPSHLKSTEEWLPFQRVMSFCLSEVSSSSEQLREFHRYSQVWMQELKPTSEGVACGPPAR